MEGLIDVDMKVRGLKSSDAADWTLWRLGCSNRLTPACGDNKPGSRLMMTVGNEEVMTTL